ncbi:hypothetical protein AYO21_04981 [Fonsecaea monophora]|uniref:DUF1868 domain-containing protein n=1 Tax=Fonsecaea monophora TaxID=254056 RepID=A0A177F9M5_9EURO|nr:hypothetical protein AYO21_04981 [Fonsecaea monophora]KAH0841384.1 hypothetical protein FOPE_06506 [Fonsecaea pedrosoi]OAG40904.1 hypothetical protein AYO21_04981 [Fonsecaea monophora]
MTAPTATTTTTTTATTTLSETAVTLARSPYPEGVPVKFSPDGLAQRYPGNTTICHIPLDSPLISGLRAIHDALGSHATLAHFFRLVPPETWHMTVLDGVREIECEGDMWPEDLEKRPLDEYTVEFSKTLGELGDQLQSEGLAPPYKMRVRGFDPAVVGVGLEIEGATDEEEKRMRRLRDRLADAMGFRAPRHDMYIFHVTVAYLLRHVDGDDRLALNKTFAELLPKVKMEFDLGAVEFCVFQDMCAYPRLFYLGREGGESA